jgi:hypothetical protein
MTARPTWKGFLKDQSAAKFNRAYLRSRRFVRLSATPHSTATSRAVRPYGDNHSLRSFKAPLKTCDALSSSPSPIVGTDYKNRLLFVES